MLFQAFPGNIPLLERLRARLEFLVTNYSKSYEQPRISAPDLRDKVETVKQEYKKKIADAIWKAMDVIECELGKRVPNFKRLASLEEALGRIDSIIESFTEYYKVVAEMEGRQPEIRDLERDERVKKENGKAAREVKGRLRSTLELVRQYEETLRKLLEGILSPDEFEQVKTNLDMRTHGELMSRAVRLLQESSRALEDAKTLPTTPENADTLAAARDQLNEVFYRCHLEFANLQKRETVGARSEQ